MRTAPTVELSASERADLERWAAMPSPSTRVVGRAKIVLEAAEGRSNTEIAANVGVHPGTVARWRTRFLLSGLDGLRREAPRGGHATRVPDEFVERILRKTLDERAPGNAAWSTRSLARSLAVNHMMVHRVWTAYRLTDSSRDAAGSPRGLTPYVDLAGLYLSPPATAAVFAVELRAAAGRSSRSLPKIVPNVTGSVEFSDPEEATRDFAEMLRRFDRPRRTPYLARHALPTSFLVFLRAMEDRTPRTARLDLMLDRPLSTIDSRVQDWLAVHPRFHVFTVGMDESWSRSVETWMLRWDRTRIHRNSFRGLPECLGAFQPVSGPGALRTPPRAWLRPPAGLPDLGPAGPVPARPTLEKNRRRASPKRNP